LIRLLGSPRAGPACVIARNFTRNLCDAIGFEAGRFQYSNPEIGL
jgi:hypothetical protein